MSYDDFLCQFTKLEMCMMTPVCESMRKDDAWLSRRQWKVTGHQGAWQRQVNAGGCRNYLGETRLIDGQFTQDDSPGAAPRRQWKVTGTREPGSDRSTCNSTATALSDSAPGAAGVAPWWASLSMPRHPIRAAPVESLRAFA